MDKTVIETMVAYQRAQDVLDQYDRPLHRRKHETKIAQAKREIDQLPSRAEQVLRDVDAAAASLDRLGPVEASATAVLLHRPELETAIGGIDEQIERDPRTRTRITKAE